MNISNTNLDSLTISDPKGFLRVWNGKHFSILGVAVLIHAHLQTVPDGRIKGSDLCERMRVRTEAAKDLVRDAIALGGFTLKDGWVSAGE